ncbi:MAG TPA: hypothetical protein VEH04_06060 [Verrucomicrobiae bacterium]|nr:hypothetical protein [Verrucomicrobiae bacterium]
MSNRFTRVFGRSACGAFLMVYVWAHAAPGDLDLSFAGTGTARTGFGGGNDQAHAAAVQADGKLLMGGYCSSVAFTSSEFCLVRFDTNHVLDASFGDGGQVLTPVNASLIPFTDARITALKVQADGRIVAGGYSYIGTNYPTFTLVRYLHDGSLDSSFGTNGNGIVQTDFGEPTRLRALAIQGDGKIVAVGSTTYPANAGEGAVALARYTTNGLPDPSFGNAGTQITTGVTGYTGAHAVTIRPDGKILAAGIGIGAGHNGIDFALYCYTTNGVLDPQFGGGTGKVFTQISTNNNLYFDSANAVAIQFGNNSVQNPDRIVVAGSYRTSGSPSETQFALTRYQMDGALDTTFGNNGIVTNRLASGGMVFNLSSAIGLVVQGTFTQPRRILVGGYSLNGSNRYFVMARYNSAGGLDTTFGNEGTGIAAVPLGNRDAAATALAVQPGRFIVAGYAAQNAQNYNFAAVAFDSAGILDTTFGAEGFLVSDISDVSSSGRGVAVQPDGRVIVAGSANDGERDQVAVARFNVDGSLDATFGAGGKVLTPVGSGSASGTAVALQPNGGIVVAGTANDDFLVVRYQGNGALDPSFGTNGIVTTSIGSGSDVANAIALQADGRLVVAGNSDNGSNTDFAVVRYTTNGFPDVSFDGDGKTTTAISTSSDYVNAVQVQANGRIVVAGYAEINGNIDAALVRYHTNGMLDNSFGSFGRVATDVGNGTTDAGFALLIQPDQRIVVAGYSATGANIDVMLLRYTTNGILDSSFDGDGKVTTAIGLAAEYAAAAALQSDGKIVAAGVASIGSHLEFAAVRYLADGSLDGSFGLGGKAVVDFANNADNTGYAIALDGSGRVVIAGEAGGLMGVARLQGDPFLRILSIARLANGQVALTGSGSPGATHSLQAIGSLGGNFSTIAPVIADSDGSWEFLDTSTPATNRFYRLSLP